MANKYILQGVKEQAKKLAEEQAKVKAEYENKKQESNAETIDIRDGGNKMTTQDIQNLLEQQAGAIMELTERLDAFEKRGNE
ncbi:hypothetical protein [Virgibacillus salexigens]|uniref:hypothetical protein n=1 Tax=Virgibacillus salexigens TaxID=61016 RepID=UPI001909BD32|nr:hypothetical protein [Virgibacillus salexigens]